MSNAGPVAVMIASPLEAAHADQIAAAYPDRVLLDYRPDLLPPTRYVADHKGDPDWRRTPDQETAWRGLLQRAEVLWDFPIGETAPIRQLCPNLRWVQTTSAGIGPLVVRLGLQQSDLIVTTASGIHAQPLAEFVFGALLYHTKRFSHLESEQDAHRWERFCAGELRGRVLALIGPGRIGREVARVAHAFGMLVWAMGRRYDPERTGDLGVDQLFPSAELETMLAGADVLVLCVPETAETERLISRAALAALKPGAVVINVARGSVIDEAALLDSLRSGHVAFAALDVFSTEPLPPDSPFWDLPNVLVSPHSASTADTENAKLTDRFITNLGHYLNGAIDQMTPVFDKRRLY